MVTGFLARYLNRFAMLVAGAGFEPTVLSNSLRRICLRSPHGSDSPLDCHSLPLGRSQSSLPSSYSPFGLITLGRWFENFYKKEKTLLKAKSFWLRGPDLNQRPSGYEPDELPAAPPRDIQFYCISIIH